MSNETNIDDLTFTDQLTFEGLDTDDFTSVVTQIADKGIAILFTYVDDESSVVEASITDNYVETNHSVQDHIAIKPRIYRLRGCVGEVVFKTSNEWNKWIGDKINSNPILSKTLNAMKPIASISGIVSNATNTAMAVVNQLESSYNRYKKMIENNFLNKKTKISGKMQETVVADLNRILEQRIAVNLKGLKFETTFTAGDDYERQYYLQSVSAHQGNNAFISDIEITIKEFRIATTKVSKVDPQNKISITKAPEVNTSGASQQEPAKPAVEAMKSTWKNIKENHPVVAKTIKTTTNALLNNTPKYDLGKLVQKGAIGMFTAGYKLITGGK